MNAPCAFIVAAVFECREDKIKIALILFLFCVPLGLIAPPVVKPLARHAGYFAEIGNVQKIVVAAYGFCNNLIPDLRRASHVHGYFSLCSAKIIFFRNSSSCDK